VCCPSDPPDYLSRVGSAAPDVRSTEERRQALDESGSLTTLKGVQDCAQSRSIREALR